MRKCTFFKTMHDPTTENKVRLQKAEGWEETIYDADGNKITLCMERNIYGCWNVTEKTTGCAICGGMTRKEAVEKVKLHYLNVIHNNIANIPEIYKTLITQAYAEV